MEASVHWTYAISCSKYAGAVTRARTRLQLRHPIQLNKSKLVTCEADEEVKGEEEVKEQKSKNESKNPDVDKSQHFKSQHGVC